MFSCSFNAKLWIKQALRFLPDDIQDDFESKFAFVCMDSSDGRRLTKSFRRGRELIILSERIIPRWLESDERRTRYFIFVILHEVAHAICEHVSPNEAEDGEAQEQEADKLAFHWLNTRLREMEQLEFSNEELVLAKAASQEVANQYMNAG